VSYIVQAFDTRPAPIGGPMGEAYAEPTRELARERALRMAKDLSRDLPPKAEDWTSVHVLHYDDDGQIRLMNVIHVSRSFQVGWERAKF
jgi:hypothetical protein